MRRKNTEKAAPIEQALTAQHDIFIAALMTGTSIHNAAALAGVSRRSASTWLQPGHPARAEYERQRSELSRKTMDRIGKLREMAIDAMEAALTSEVDVVRFNAAKFIYTEHFINRGAAGRIVPEDADEILKSLQSQRNDDSVSMMLSSLIEGNRPQFSDDDDDE